MLKVNQLKSNVNKMNTNDEVFINAINLSTEAISELIRMIKKGTLILNEDQLKKYIKAEAQNEYRTGKRISPQMVYIKK